MSSNSLITVVIPTAGMFYHNEKLWAALAAAQLEAPFELIIPMTEPVSPRLITRLEQLKIKYRSIVCRAGAGVGDLFAAGTDFANGKWTLWLHDDCLPKDSFGLFLKRMTTKTTPHSLHVPHVENSANPDQAGYCNGLTSHYVDRCCIAFETELYRKFRPAVSKFKIDGYQLAVQKSFADNGHGCWVMQLAHVDHEGGQSLLNLGGKNYQSQYDQDTAALAEMLGTWVENGSRPAIPRIIARGHQVAGDLFGIYGGAALEAINLLDQDRFTYKKHEYGRVTTGTHYTIPPLMDFYDVALVRDTGLGDALMHTAAVHHFKRQYPHVLFRLHTYAGVATVASHCTVWDQVIVLDEAQPLPPNARLWNVWNGVEGTPVHGFNDLGINEIPANERRMGSFDCFGMGSVDPIMAASRNIVGIQLNGGWRHKRLQNPVRIADEVAAAGYSPVFFGTDAPPMDNPYPVIKTPTIQDFAQNLKCLKGWIGFDSGGSYLANCLGIPSVWLFASHNPGGLIEQCGAAAPFRTIWPNKMAYCARVHGATCRPGLNAAFNGWGTCGRLHPTPGAVCLDEIEPSYIVGELQTVLAAKAKQ